MTLGSCEMSGGRTLMATSRSRVKSCARKTAPIPPFPTIRSILYLPSTMRCNRLWRPASSALVVAAPPVWSAPQAKQNLLLSGSGGWHLRHSMAVADVRYLGTANGMCAAFKRCSMGANVGMRYTDGASCAGGDEPGGVHEIAGPPLAMQR